VYRRSTLPFRAVMSEQAGVRRLATAAVLREYSAAM
jgi:hypothetical protein